MAKLTYSTKWNSTTQSEITNLLYHSLLETPKSNGTLEEHSERIYNVSYAIGQLVDMLVMSGALTAAQVVAIVEKYDKSQYKDIKHCEIFYTN